MISNTRRVVFTVAKVAIDQFDCAIDVARSRKSVHWQKESVCVYTRAFVIISLNQSLDMKYIKVVGNSIP